IVRCQRCSARPPGPLAAAAGGSRVGGRFVTGTGVLPPGQGGPGGRTVQHPQVPHDAYGRRTHGRATDRGGGSPHHASGSLPEAVEDGRVAATDQRGAGRNGSGGSTP